MTYHEVMKTMNIAELKAHLSRCLREVAGGERIVVLDRRRPVAEIVPISHGRENVWIRLQRTRGARLGTQDRSGLRFSRVKTRIDVVELVREIQRDSTE